MQLAGRYFATPAVVIDACPATLIEAGYFAHRLFIFDGFDDDDTRLNISASFSCYFRLRVVRAGIFFLSQRTRSTVTTISAAMPRVGNFPADIIV